MGQREHIYCIHLSIDGEIRCVSFFLSEECRKWGLFRGTLCFVTEFDAHHPLLVEAAISSLKNNQTSSLRCVS